MRTEREYKIDKYIEMARLTKDIEKRENLIDWAQHYLELTEEVVSEQKYKSRLPYLDELKKEDIIGRPTKDCYQNYVTYCNEKNEMPITHRMFSKEIIKVFSVRTKSVKFDGVVKKAYTEV